MRARGYALLDVVLAITILAVVVLVSLQTFHRALSAVRRGEVMARASMYAEAKIQEFQLNPPAEDLQLEGSFAEDPFYRDERLFPDADNFFWRADFEIEEVEYEDTLTRLNFRVIHDDGDRGFNRWVPLEIDTYLLGHERHSLESRRENLL